MSDRSATMMVTDEQPAVSGTQRLMIACLIGGCGAAFAGAIILWSLEGPRIFVDILLAGVAACL